MKTKSAIGFSLLTIISLSFFAAVFSRPSTTIAKAETGNYTRNQATYYTDDFSHKISSSQYGTTLLSTLHELMFDSHKKFNSYDELWTYTKQTDYDIDNTDNIILLYSRQSVNGVQNSNVWNREHVWCQSKGFFGTNIAAGTDLHHLRPASVNYNSARSNTPYGVIANHSNDNRMGDTDCYLTDTCFDPADYIKGDVARVLMYVYMHYASAVGGTSTYTGSLSITDIVYTSSGTAQAAWDLLMDWNESDPVDYQEMIRNNKCANLLGNYNPFIDHPEFARMIWDDSSDQQAGLFFQSSYKTVSVGSSYTNTAYKYGRVSTSDDIIYTSDNPDIATVDLSTGQVTGVSNGVVRIKARCTINGVTKISYHFVVVGSGYTPKDTLNASGIVYTPTSKTTAVASHKISSETVSYSNTYDGISQMTSGNTITLTINNFPKTISSIILFMHSNSKSGTGSINVTVGGTTYKTISNQTFVQMYGSYTQTFVPIDVTNSSASKKTGTVVIQISCSANSLYFQKAVIDYEERAVTKATSISISPSSATLTPGEDCVLMTSFSPSTTTLKTNTWTSSNTNVATVNKYGLVKAISVGNATITATTSDGSNKTGTATITVANSVVPAGDPTVTGVTVSPSSTTLDVTGNPSTTLSATVNGTNNPSQAVTWSVSSSSPSGCVTVNSSGVVTANNAGSAVVIATSVADDTYYGSCNVTVTNKTLSSISIDTTNVQKSFTVGDTFNYTGLVVTATFSTGQETVTPTSVSSPDMSTSGDKTITISYAFGDTTKTATYEINVSESSGGSQRVVSNSSSEYFETGSIYLTGNTSSGTATCDAFTVTQSKNSGGNIVYTYDEIRIYASHSLMIAPKEDYTITSVILTADSNNYANAVGGSSLTNCTKSVSSLTVTLTPTDGESTLGFTNTEQSRIRYLVVNYTYSSSSSPSLTWTAPTINTYAGTILTGENANSWGVTYNNGSGSITNPTYQQFSVKLGGSTISLPYTWTANDDGKTLCVSYNSLTTDTTTVSIVQNLNTINKTVPGESTKSTLTFTAACGGSGTADDDKSWAVSSDGTESNYESTKGIHYGTSGAAVKYIKLTSTAFTTGTITKVVVQASTASGVSATVSVKIGGSAFGGDAQSLTSSNASYTFNGEVAAGTIEVTITKPSSAYKALYCKGVEVTYSTQSQTSDIANASGHEDAQRAVVKFAKAFNTALGATNSCTTGLTSAWETANSAWNTFLSEAAALGSTEEAYAKDLIANANALWTPDTDSDYKYCLERALATYEKCVNVHGMTDFMSSVRTISSSSFVKPFINISKNANSVIILSIVIGLTALSIGGYFFLKRKKED